MFMKIGFNFPMAGKPLGNISGIRVLRPSFPCSMKKQYFSNISSAIPNGVITLKSRRANWIRMRIR